MDIVHDVADLLRRITRQDVEEHPEVVLQLSGGLDSRVQLAAIPAQLRPGLRALTLSERGSPDVAIARRLTAIHKLDHQLLQLDPITNLDPADVYALVRRTALRFDCSTDPLALALLDWAEGQLETGFRMHGLGGEIARGIYHAGLGQHETVRPALVDRLAKWRLFANEAIDPACMGPAWGDWAREVTLTQLREIFSGYESDWLNATDTFYIRERMARWAGPRLTVASVERTLLGPLLHPEFIALVCACPPQYKSGSRFMARVLQELDPGLARVPLDSGYIPVGLADPNPVAKFRSGAVTARRAASKACQRLSHTRRPDTGAPLLADRMLMHWRSNPSLLDGLGHLGVIDDNWLSELLAGRRTADASTVGHLASLEVIAEVVTAP